MAANLLLKLLFKHKRNGLHSLKYDSVCVYLSPHEPVLYWSIQLPSQLL